MSVSEVSEESSVGRSTLHDAITSDYVKTTTRGGLASSNALAFAGQNYLRWIDGWVPNSASKSALDLGCGTGPMIYLLASRGVQRIVGVDLCREELDIVHSHVASAELHHADVLTYLKSAPDETFDFICAMNLLEHLPNDVLFGTLKECRRALKAGGSLVAMVPNAQSPFGGMTRYWDMTHQNAFTPASIRQLATVSGFATGDVEFRDCGPRPHGLKSTVRYVLWQGIRAFVAGWLMIETASTKSGIYSADMVFRIIKRTSDAATANL